MHIHEDFYWSTRTSLGSLPFLENNVPEEVQFEIWYAKHVPSKK
jgi:hypothetical protein